MIAFTLRDAVRFVLIAAASSIAGVLVALFWLSRTEPLYEVRMVIAPAESLLPKQPLPRISSIASLLGAAGAGQADDFALLRETLFTVGLAERLEERHGLVRRVFAGSWDEQSSSWVRRVGLGGHLRGMLGLPSWTPPDAHSLVGFLKENLVARSVGSGMMSLTLRYGDREEGIRILAIIFQEADDMVRERSIQRLTAATGYISGRLNANLNVDHKMALIELLKDNEIRAMLATSDLPYAAQVIDRPAAPMMPSSPSVVRILALGMFMGGLVGLCLAYVFVILLRPRRPAPSDCQQ